MLKTLYYIESDDPLKILNLNFFNISGYFRLLLKLLIDYLGPEFYLGIGGRDCIEDEVVTKKSDCRYAAKVLNKEYKKESEDPHYDRPAGCYYLTLSDDVHYNTILDPSGTNDLLYSSKGVCVRSMYLLYNLSCIIEITIFKFQCTIH